MKAVCRDFEGAGCIENWEAGPQDRLLKAVKVAQTAEKPCSMTMRGLAGMLGLRRAETCETVQQSL